MALTSRDERGKGCWALQPASYPAVHLGALVLALLVTACGGEKFGTSPAPGELNGGDAGSDGVGGGGGQVGAEGAADGAADGAAGGGQDGGSSVERDAGIPPLDAGSLDGSLDTTCDAPTPYHRDRDGDGFGANDRYVVACAPPSEDGWVTIGGDCNDDNADVHPGQKEHFGFGYPDTDAPLGVSFDYDCDGVESGDPENRYASAPVCDGLIGLGCTGIGYLDVIPSRSGGGIDSRCGSTRLRQCVSGVTCASQEREAEEPFRCR